MDLIETGCEDVKWIQINHHRIQWRVLVKTVMKTGKFWTNWVDIDFLKMTLHHGTVG
jgi:hypothetical protein